MARRKRDSRRKRKNWFEKGTKSRKVLMGLCIGVISALVLAALGFYQLLSWLQSDGFRDYMSERLCDKVQGESVDIPQNLNIQGNRISLPALHLERNSLLSVVTAKRASSEVERSALLDRHIKFDKMTVEELAITVDTAKAGEEPELPKEKERHFWERFAPHTTTVASFECKDTDLNLLVGGKRYGLSGVSVTADPQGKDQPLLTLRSSRIESDRSQRKRIANTWQVELENGRLRSPLYYLQDCSVKSATLLISADEESKPTLYNLGNCRVQLSPGELNLKGSFNAENKLWSTSLSVSKANVGRLLLGDWKKRLTGELFGTLKLTGKGAEISEASGSLRLRQAILEGLPILSELEVDNTRPFRTIALSKAECRISYPYNEPTYNISHAWLFDGIDLRSQDDKLRLTGHVIIGSDGSLGGTLCLGISKPTLQEYGLEGDEVLADLFTGKGNENYRWINLNLSGTLDAPQEDLSVRISTIMRNALPEMAASAVKKTGNALINLLPGKKAKPGRAQETPDGPEAPEEEPEPPTPAGKLIDDTAKGAGGLIKSGLDMIF